MLFICKLLLIGDIIITPGLWPAGISLYQAPQWGEEMVLT